MNLELLWHVDEKDVPSGSTTRDEAHSNPAIIHRAVLIAIQNENNEYLLQKRSINVDKYPGHWTVSASGHVKYLEEYLAAAERELEEELGLVGVALSFIGTLLIRTEEESQYIGIFKGEITSQHRVSAHAEAISKLRLVSPEELIRLLAEEQFTPFAYPAFELLLQNI